MKPITVKKLPLKGYVLVFIVLLLELRKTNHLLISTRRSNHFDRPVYVYLNFIDWD